MANTFSQIYFQFVFAGKGRESLISKNNKEELHKYITSLIQARGAKLIAINCMPDHIHIFVGFKPSIFIPDFVKEIKVQSNEFINNKGWIRGRFKWQDGYGIFSYSQSHIGSVISYIQNQEEHHQKKTFKQEFVALLDKFEIPFKEKVFV